MIAIVDKKDKKNKSMVVIAEKKGSFKFCMKYGLEPDGDMVQMIDGKIFRFPNYEVKHE